MDISKKIATFFLFIVYLTTFLLLTPKTVKAQYLFQDDFEIDASQWSALSGTWSINPILSSNRYGSTVIPSFSCCSETTAGNTTWTNYTYEANVVSTQGGDRNLVFRYQASNIKYGVHLTNSSISLEKHIPGNSVDLIIANGTFSNNNDYLIKVIANNNNYKIYVNNIEYINYTDNNNPILNGKIGFRVGTGATAPATVWFDNVKVSAMTPSPTPTTEPTPVPSITPSESPTATPSPIPVYGIFDLPFDYPNRGNSKNDFIDNFWNKLTAVFDHQFLSDQFVNYLGLSSSSCTIPFNCYDSHNGTDFSDLPNDDVLSPAAGKVVYASTHTTETCTQESTYGCVVIAKYSGNNYGLFAHLSKINVNINDLVTPQTIIGKTGTTGCGACGKHLHFGVIRPKNIKDNLLAGFMKKADWKSLLQATSSNQSYCGYNSPMGVSFVFTDPFGWDGSYKDPWSLPKNKSGCGVRSNYLWRYQLD